MAITQAQFETALTDELSREGWELSKRDVRELLDVFASVIKKLLADELKVLKKNKEYKPKITIRGIGIFKVNSRPAGWGRNPGTGEKIRVKASKKMKVLPPKAMRDSLGVK